MNLPSYPSAVRNKNFIFETLRKYLPKKGKILEVASGTGEHICFFGKGFPSLVWQPSDKTVDLFWAIRARAVSENNVQNPILIDLLEEKNRTTLGRYIGLVNINMIHISPWEACEGLFRLAEKVILNGGFVYLYGPFKVNGVHTSPSNFRFDTSLRERDSKWGVRDLEDVIAVAKKNGFNLIRSHEMPANNKSIVFEKI